MQLDRAFPLKPAQSCTQPPGESERKVGLAGCPTQSRRGKLALTGPRPWLQGIVNWSVPGVPTVALPSMAHEPLLGQHPLHEEPVRSPCRLLSP